MSCSFSQTIRYSVAKIRISVGSPSVCCVLLRPAAASSAVSPLVDAVRGRHARAAHQHDAHQPQPHLGELGVAEEVQPELEAEDELGEGDHEEDPALGAQPLAAGVRHVGVVLADGGRRDQPRHQDPRHADGVLSRHREDVLDEEGVELDHLPDEHQLDDGHQPHVGGGGVQPPHVGPALGGELQQPACT